ncbi:hypothetical protein R2X23_03150 [Citrobacter braakii]|jgi:hypothetical protein|uniref:hypothetical protein n=1 Tax=Citrobacter braakii TaxID=57706 RepID=UPI0024E10FB6|nr:hypothetical protein [Citrobacter braakii]WOR25714.1 hypothetical protein R2X23_03150 [Citrobacter braakii]
MLALLEPIHMAERVATMQAAPATKNNFLINFIASLRSCVGLLIDEFSIAEIQSQKD